MSLSVSVREVHQANQSVVGTPGAGGSLANLLRSGQVGKCFVSARFWIRLDLLISGELARNVDTWSLRHLSGVEPSTLDTFCTP